jgi:hypothetical protein
MNAENRCYFYDTATRHLLVFVVQSDKDDFEARRGVLAQGGWTEVVVAAVCPGGSCASSRIAPLARFPAVWLPRTYFKATLCDVTTPTVCKGSVFAQLNLDTFALFTRVNHNVSPGVAGVLETAVMQAVLEFSGGVRVLVGGLAGSRNTTILTAVRAGVHQRPVARVVAGLGGTRVFSLTSCVSLLRCCYRRLKSLSCTAGRSWCGCSSAVLPACRGR